MEGTIKLKKPIPVNGVQVEELTYNTDEITVTLFSEADARKRMLPQEYIYCALS